MGRTPPLQASARFPGAGEVRAGHGASRARAHKYGRSSGSGGGVFFRIRIRLFPARPCRRVLPKPSGSVASAFRAHPPIQQRPCWGFSPHSLFTPAMAGAPHLSGFRFTSGFTLAQGGAEVKRDLHQISSHVGMEAAAPFLDTAMAAASAAAFRHRPGSVPRLFAARK